MLTALQSYTKVFLHLLSEEKMEGENCKFVWLADANLTDFIALFSECE